MLQIPTLICVTFSSCRDRALLPENSTIIASNFISNISMLTFSSSCYGGAIFFLSLCTCGIRFPKLKKLILQNAYGDNDYYTRKPIYELNFNNIFPIVSTLHIDGNISKFDQLFDYHFYLKFASICSLRTLILNTVSIKFFLNFTIYALQTPGYIDEHKYSPETEMGKFKKFKHWPNRDYCSLPYTSLSVTIAADTYHYEGVDQMIPDSIMKCLSYYKNLEILYIYTNVLEIDHFHRLFGLKSLKKLLISTCESDVPPRLTLSSIPTTFPIKNIFQTFFSMNISLYISKQVQFLLVCDNPPEPNSNDWKQNLYSEDDESEELSEFEFTEQNH
jgi:hypothetical protein